MNKDIMSSAEFGEIYEKYKDDVLQTAMLYLSIHTAEDITQEAFLKFFTLKPEIEVANIRGWLMTVTKNLAFNYVRDNKKIISVDVEASKDNLFGYGDSTEDIYFERIHDDWSVELRDSILDQLYRENKRWFEAITLTYNLKKPQQEVAERMGISLETLHSLLYRAKKWIRKHYESEYRDNYKE